MKPFTVEYNVLKLGAKDHIVSSSKEEINAATTNAQIRLHTNEPGKYRYELTHLSDAIHDDPKNLAGSFILEQHVRPLPTAKFVETGEPHVYCADTSFDNPKKNGIPLLVSGTFPITVTLELRHELQHSVERLQLDVTEKQYFFVPAQHTLTHGLHTLTILQIADSKGCVSQPTDNNRATYTVADEASISPLEQQQHHCVGDRISYILQGTSPWQIEHEFNGERKIAKTSNPTFSRIAGKKGNLTIVSVADSARWIHRFWGRIERWIFSYGRGCL